MLVNQGGNASGTVSVGMLSVTTMTNLVTGDSTTETTSTFPAYVPIPAAESFLEPGSYWYFLLNPSAMDDDMEGVLPSIPRAKTTVRVSTSMTRLASSSTSWQPTCGWPNDRQPLKKGLPSPVC